MALWKIQDLLYLFIQLIQNIGIHKTQQDQERRTHGGTDNATNSAEAIEAIRDGCCSSRNYD